jgi:hypothetical protein
MKRSLATLGLAAAATFAIAHDEEPGAAAHARLGKVHFENSCAPSVARNFDISVALLHSFWVKDAVDGFNVVLKSDPACAIAYWGIAMTLQGNPLTGQEPTPQAMETALAALDKADALGAKTQRERDYIAAISHIYRNAAASPFRARRAAYEKAMEALSQQYPADTEAKIFYALALDMTADLSDRSYSHQLRAAAILESLAVQQPEHPGIAHYLIHSYDYPAIAARGVEAARRYAAVAPQNPHALHMPSHIFTRLGIWQDSIETNKRSAAAAKTQGNGQEQVHAMDYMVHAYLQLGQDVQARRVVDEAGATAVNTAVFIGPYARAAMPARYALERRAWREAVSLEPAESRFAFTPAITRFARGLGFAHLGNTPAALEEAEALGRARDQLKDQGNSYWSNQVEVQRLAVVAWAAFAQGRADEAVERMRASADLEDSMEKHIVTPSAVVPARELLGDLFLELKRPADALAAYEASAQREPNRLLGIYGIAQAAALTGDREKARAYYARLTEIARHAEPGRPELERAKERLAQR